MGKQLYNDKREAFRAALKELRIAAGLTQEELASKLGRHQSYVSDYERGNRRLDWVAVDEIVAACKGDLTAFAASYLRASSKLPA